MEAGSLDPPGSLPFVVASEDKLNQFETVYVDEHTKARYTITFFLGEPVLYHPPHQAKASFTHITHIAKDCFVVGTSTTDRMFPVGRAQQVLFKLSLDEIERELDGTELDAGEKLIWRRWVDAEARRFARKNRVQAPCCGRYTCRYQLETDEGGLQRCGKCRTLPDRLSLADQTLKQQQLAWQYFVQLEILKAARTQAQPAAHTQLAYLGRRGRDGADAARVHS